MTYNEVYITDEMVGRKLGEFSHCVEGLLMASIVLSLVLEHGSFSDMNTRRIKRIFMLRLQMDGGVEFTMEQDGFSTLLSHEEDVVIW
ncbi:uncharacterized protein PADG_05526 [Paracoccidioides brasiliensis Pb18]|uniref:Uncharacterized protein n=1 Tax=Paracoccidioides brasiliensis (strain Pb18) TaxID=502780 RepID=C1GE40_PARBD|nr:uncharacterized protein PADG_05526 [Paracoccidioides brasiliensis Pb18]EEH49447.2 hypothetical protein PADG_05526 [Paracoccidioides brasiliensis Pb18]